MESGSARIYKYVGGDQKWISVTAAAGQIAVGGTTGISGVSKLQVVGNDLYAATMSNPSWAGIAEVYKLSNVNLNKSYSIMFHAEPSVAGGDAGAAESVASMFFLASASANLGSTAGNTGAFIFSHGIQTRNGSYDVAEDYPTRDDTLEPGDLVAVDKNEKGFVTKTSQAYDYSVLGVYSQKPALRLSQDDVTINGGRAIPVALAGRVPVKVSTESGEIKSGDYLTSSSIPGVAMKATKSSVVIGQAMEPFTSADGGIGRVMAFIKSMTYNGDIADEFANLDTNAPQFAVNVLDKLNTQSIDGKSSILTDRLIAGLEIITPKLSATKVNLNEINVLSGNDIALNLSSDGKFIIKDASGSAAITFDSSGNAYFAGLVFADKIKANQIEGLEIFTNQLSSISKNMSVLSASTSSAVFATPSGTLNITDINVEGLAQIKGDINVNGNGIFDGMLTVLKSITTPNLIVSEFASFFNNVVFKGDVRFEGRPTFNSDTAGFAKVSKGKTSIAVNFENEYLTLPVVTASIVLDKTFNATADAKLEDAVLAGNISYVITQRTTKGFVIKINKALDQDISFSWVALSVVKPKEQGQNQNQDITVTDSSATQSAAFQSVLNQLNNNSPGLTSSGPPQ
jgi:hypothetical protein